MKFIKKKVLGTHVQDSRKIKTHASVVDLAFFEKLVSRYQTHGNSAEIADWSSEEHQNEK